VAGLRYYRILDKAGLSKDLLHYDCGLDLKAWQPIAKPVQVEPNCFREGANGVID
jgi:hypothetical protein